MKLFIVIILTILYFVCITILDKRLDKQRKGNNEKGTHN
jgi:hypothetical protein